MSRRTLISLCASIIVGIGCAAMISDEALAYRAAYRGGAVAYRGGAVAYRGGAYRGAAYRGAAYRGTAYRGAYYRGAAVRRGVAHGRARELSSTIQSAANAYIPGAALS